MRFTGSFILSRFEFIAVLELAWKPSHILLTNQIVDMSLIFLVFLIFLVIVLIAVSKAHSRSTLNQSWPFYAKKPLSQPEQVLYFRLVEALPENIVLAQVQLSRLLGVKKGNNYQSWFNRINRMSADFVICNKDSSIVAVIELDDASHASSARQAADLKKDKALSSASIKVIRWNVKNIPDAATIRTAVIPPALAVVSASL